MIAGYHCRSSFQYTHTGCPSVRWCTFDNIFAYVFFFLERLLLLFLLFLLLFLVWSLEEDEEDEDEEDDEEDEEEELLFLMRKDARGTFSSLSESDSDEDTDKDVLACLFWFFLVTSLTCDLFFIFVADVDVADVFDVANVTYGH